MRLGSSTLARTHTHTQSTAQVALVLLISYRDEVLYKIEQTVIELRDGIVEKWINKPTAAAAAAAVADVLPRSA